MDYTLDEWRNALSLDRSRGAVGITYNAWNGYTEGLTAVPTREHGDSQWTWLKDLYSSDPRECRHIEYENGQPSKQISGAFCEKWRDLDGVRGPLGLLVSEESASAQGRVVHFSQGSVFFHEEYGAHEVHGAIHALYKSLGFDGSCLGLPISDEEAWLNGRISRFEGGEIVFVNGSAQSQCF